MRKIAPLILLLLIPLSVAVDYDTSLINDEPEEIFRSEGWITSVSEESIDLTLSYNLTFDDVNYNKTQINNFTVILADDEAAIESRHKQPGKLEKDGWKSGFVSFESDKTPDRVEQVKFLVEHKATHFEGYKVEEQVQGFFKFSINERNPEINSFTTSKPEVRRGENITAHITTSSIETLKTGETNFSRTGENRFKANLTIPYNAETNKSPVYTLEDGRGNIFREELNTTLVNTPPQIQLEFDRNIEDGKNTEIKVKTSDDQKVNRTYIDFRGRRYNPDGDKVTLLTEDVPPGEHEFKVTSVDNENLATTRTGTLKAPGNKKQKNTEAGKQEKNNAEETGESSIIAPLIDFFNSIF